MILNAFTSFKVILREYLMHIVCRFSLLIYSFLDYFVSKEPPYLSQLFASVIWLKIVGRWRNRLPKISLGLWLCYQKSFDIEEDKKKSLWCRIVGDKLWRVKNQLWRKGKYLAVRHCYSNKESMSKIKWEEGKDK